MVIAVLALEAATGIALGWLWGWNQHIKGGLRVAIPLLILLVACTAAGIMLSHFDPELFGSSVFPVTCIGTGFIVDWWLRRYDRKQLERQNDTDLQ